MEAAHVVQTHPQRPATYSPRYNRNTATPFTVYDGTAAGTPLGTFYV